MTFFRIDLQGDGTGYLASSFLDRPAVLSRITTWTLQGWRLAMQTTPVDLHPNDVMSLSGEVVLLRLDLKILGGKGDSEWREHVSLFREDVSRSAQKRVNERMEALK